MTFDRNLRSDAQVAVRAIERAQRAEAMVERLAAALRSDGAEYDIDGRQEWHDRRCIYRKTWPMGGEDEEWCAERRALLAEVSPEDGT